jgi:S-adenosylmethionine decarboxylase
MSWGYHLMLDCGGCNDNIASKDKITDFVNELVNKIDMISHGAPVIEYLLEGEPNQGYSLLQLITTSNISAHFMEIDHTAYFDIFSCKEFEISTAIKVVKQYFDPLDIKMNFITREATRISR